MTNPASKAELSKEAIMVRDALIAHGLETPWIDNGLTTAQKKKLFPTA